MKYTAVTADLLNCPGVQIQWDPARGESHKAKCRALEDQFEAVLAKHFGGLIAENARLRESLEPTE